MKSKKRVAIVSLIVLVIALPIFLFAAYQYQQIRSRAAPPPIGSVHINPEGISTDLLGNNVNLSTLAYDQSGNPIWFGVSYQWGISSTNSVGTLYPNANDKLATFKPSATNRGIADIWVKAYTVDNQTVTGSIPVYVGVPPPPSPTPTATPTYKLTVTSPNGGETLVQDQTYRITWTSTNNFDSVTLYLFGYDTSETSLLKSNFPDTGYYDWVVDRRPLPYDTKFKIDLLGIKNGLLASQDTSDATFAIVPSAPTPTTSPRPTPIVTPTPTPTPTPIACLSGDINRDGVVNATDVALLLADFFRTQPANPRSDINHDGIVDITDYSLLVTQFNQGTGPCL